MMNLQNKILTFGVLLLLLATPLTARAADFTFNVPVNVQNQNANINSGEVQCQVRARQASHSQSMAEGVQLFTLDNTGSFQGTLTVAFFVNANDDPAEAGSYTCLLKFRDTDGNLVPQSAGLGTGRHGVTGDIARSASGR